MLGETAEATSKLAPYQKLGCARSETRQEFRLAAPATGVLSERRFHEERAVRLSARENGS